jgi:hypothetical protein
MHSRLSAIADIDENEGSRFTRIAGIADNAGIAGIRQRRADCE